VKGNENIQTYIYPVETKDAQGNPGVRGGMGKRMLPEQKISNYQ